MDYEKEIEQIKKRLARNEKTLKALSIAILSCTVAVLLWSFTLFIKGL